MAIYFLFLVVQISSFYIHFSNIFTSVHKILSQCMLVTTIQIVLIMSSVLILHLSEK